MTITTSQNVQMSFLNHCSQEHKTPVTVPI